MWRIGIDATDSKSFELDVITINYNGMPFLIENIESVSGLPFPVHHIVIDGESTDGSVKFLESAAEGCGYLTLRVGRDNGPADALNCGLNLTRSPTVLILNADDRLAPGVVASAWKHLRPLAQQCVVQCDARVIDACGEVIGLRLSDRFKATSWALGAVRIVHPATLTPSQYFKNGLSFDEGNRTCWDVGMYLGLEDMGASFVVAPVRVSDFRLHEGSISGGGLRQDEFRKERAQLAAAHLEHIPIALRPVLRLVVRASSRVRRFGLERRWSRLTE